MRQENDRVPPGHPAATSRAVPSAGEQLSRGDGVTAVPGDDVLLAKGDDATRRVSADQEDDHVDW